MRSLICACILLTLTACSGPDAPLRVGTNLWPGYEPLYMARELGALDPAQVKLVELSSASQVMRALQNGELDAAALTLDEAIRLASQGVDLSVALILDESTGSDAVLAHAPLADLSQLRGKRVILEPGSVGELMLEGLLKQAGLQAGDIKRVYRTANEHARAFLNREGDILITFEPMVSQLVHRGKAVIFDSRALPGQILDVLVVRNDRIATHQAALAQLTQGWFQAVTLFETQPDKALALANHRLKAADADLRAMYAGLRLGTPALQSRLNRQWPLTLARLTLPDPAGMPEARL